MHATVAVLIVASIISHLALGEDRFNYDVLNHTDLTRLQGRSGEINLETLNWGNYDLIVIDESHNFRNNDAFKDKETRYQRLMNKVIRDGVETKVLMLSTKGRSLKRSWPKWSAAVA